LKALLARIVLRVIGKALPLSRSGHIERVPDGALLPWNRAARMSGQRTLKQADRWRRYISQHVVPEGKTLAGVERRKDYEAVTGRRLIVSGLLRGAPAPEARKGAPVAMRDCPSVRAGDGDGAPARLLAGAALLAQPPAAQETPSTEQAPASTISGTYSGVSGSLGISQGVAKMQRPRLFSEFLRDDVKASPRLRAIGDRIAKAHLARRAAESPIVKAAKATAASARAGAAFKPCGDCPTPPTCRGDRACRAEGRSAVAKSSTPPLIAAARRQAERRWR
jgi:hypothetical protein